MQHEVAGGAHELVTPAGGRAFGQGLSLLLVGQPGGRGQPLDQPVQSEILVVVFHGHLIQRQGFVLEGRLFLVQGLKLALASQQDHLHAATSPASEPATVCEGAARPATRGTLGSA